MLHPLPLDIVGFLLPVALGALAFATGRSLRHRRKPLRVGVLTVTVAVVAAAGLSLAVPLPGGFIDFLSRLGGTTVLLYWAALLLLGVVWAAPGRGLSSGFIAALATLTGCLIVIETGGRLWWRFAAPELWERTADAGGCLRQRSGLTCSPAAAVMLLHRHGIPASEGEMAYLAGTSLFGTDAPSMCRALQAKVEPLGRRAEARRTDYEACRRDGT